ncbi:MAG: PKD domain-containing protein [Candidatus Lutacidiplasmatales archaeon]
MFATILLVGLAAPGPGPRGPGSTQLVASSLAAASPLSINLSAVPAAGAAPLVVAFNTTVTGGTGPYRFDWNFGDGNGSASQGPTHAYALPGEYVASVMVTDSLSATSTRTRTIDVAPAPLALSLAASGSGVDATLTTTFWANVTGGVPPFLFVWEFGDGSGAIGPSPTVVHIYHGAASYAMTVRVTDGDGLAAGGAQQVNFQPVGATGSLCAAWPAGCGPLGLPILAWLLVAVLAVALVGALGRRALRVDRRQPPRASGETPLLPPAGAVEPRDLRPSLAEAEVAPDGLSEVLVAPNGSEGRPTGPPANGQPMSTRILVHLYRQGVPDPNRVVPVAFTQEGMSVALGRPQSAFARALLRLEEAGLVRSELAHVQGRARRAKTYRLTPRGESAVRRLEAGRPR